MKNLFRFFVMAFAAVTLCNCGGGGGGEEPGPGPGPSTELDLTVENLAGSWELTSWSPSADFPDESHKIYLQLLADKTFVLYQQRINAAGIVRYDGTFTLNASARTISGEYGDGESWSADYTISSLRTSSMTWENGEEVTGYTRTAIPDSVIDQATPADEVRSAAAPRWL